MVEDSKANGSKKSTETRRLEQLPSIVLSNYAQKILIAANPWPDDLEEANRLREKLEDYKSLLAQTRKDNRLTSLEGSRMVMLYNLLKGFSKQGLAILCGVAGRVFDLHAGMDYEKHKKILAEKGIPAHVSNLKELFGDETRADLKNAAEICFNNAIRAENLATVRYESLEDLLHNEGLVVVRGFTDRSSAAWPKVKERGVCEHKLKGDEEPFKIAYYGLPSANDAPEDLVGYAYNAKEEFTKLDQFLKETNFDVLVFNGSTQLIESAIRSYNSKNKITKGRIFRKSEPKLQNKIIIVVNNKVNEVSVGPKMFVVDYDTKSKYSNLYVEGVNYKNGKMILLNPISRNTVYLGIISEPRTNLGGDNLLSLEAKVFDGYSFDLRRGLLNKVDFSRNEQLGESTKAHGLSSSLVRILKGEAALPENVGDIVNPNQPKENRSLLKVLMPYILGGAIGAGAIAAYYENGPVAQLKNYLAEYKELFKQYLEGK
ncbi:MAG: hypothetical protein Q8R00_00895 [Candidatus Nanoarchaeia archaeon]|nr:hypothetical protein [Candidatus Nanoarchaeia archaeon]